MLQRPQTLFMLLSVACLVLALAFPTLKAALPTETYELYAYGCRYCPGPAATCTAFEPHHFAEPWQIGAGLLHILALLLLGTAIGSFKKRVLQIQLLGMVNVAVFAVLAILLYAYKAVGGPDASYAAGLQIGSILFLLVPAFNLMAITRIRRDENLVRSMDRLR